MSPEQTMDRAAEILMAFVGHNNIAPPELPKLIREVYAAIDGCLSPTMKALEPELVPAVSIRASVKPDAITCLECGKKGKMLKRHLTHQHGLDEATYRARWNLPADYPLVAPNYADKRRELAKEIGLGRMPKKKGRR